MKRLWLGLGKLLGFLLIGSLILTIISPIIIFEIKMITIVWEFIFKLF